MELLTTYQPLSGYLFDAVRGAENYHIWLTSAYVTMCRELSRSWTCWGRGRGCQVKVLARWDSRDLVSGASDLEVYEIVSARGFQFFINQRFHGKCTLIDDARLFVAQCKYHRLWLAAVGKKRAIHGNLEYGTMMEPSEADCATIRDLFTDSVRVTPSLYLDIKEFIVPLLSLQSSGTARHRIPATIMEQLQGSVEGLWVRHCLGPKDLNRYHETNRTLATISCS